MLSLPHEVIVVESKPALSRYTTQLQAGLGLIDETRALLELWTPGTSAVQLAQAALVSGQFPTITARRLRNIVVECFAPRYLSAGAIPARHLRLLAAALPTTELVQLLLLFTCRAHAILGDFVRQVYWARVLGSYSHITNADARAFIEQAMDDGKTAKRWSESTTRRVSAYLTGCCADYGLLEPGLRSSRRITPPRISATTVAYLAHNLHFQGIGDNALLAHPDWQLFGLEREDVLDEVKRLSLQGLLILQAAGDVIRIGWLQPDMETLCNVLTQS